MRGFSATLALLVMVFTGAPSHAQDVVDGFVARMFKGASGVSVPYRLFVPDSKSRVERLPIIIYLHGSGGAGTDNLKQISAGNTNGTHLWTASQVQARHPAFVVVPQIPVGAEWHSSGSEVSASAAVVLELLDRLAKEFSIDADRVYLVGQSRGGFGTWDLIAKRPDLFAAAVPLCGGGDPARVTAARRMPIWVFHGAKDETVPVARSRELVAALKAAGSTVKYTEYPEIGHDVWTAAFSEPTLPDWLFAQKRAHGE